MASKKFLEWLLTEKGKNFVFGVASVGAVGFGCMKALPNTIFLENYKDFAHYYQDGFTVPLSLDLKTKFTKALELAEVPDDEKDLYKPFAVYGYDMFSAGSHLSKYGCIIGLPINFTFKNKESINKHAIRLNDNSIPWGLKEADEFLDSLMLSDKAKIYGIAREIKMTLTPKLLLDTFYQTFSVIMYYTLTNHFNTRLNLYTKPLALRVVMYILVGLFTYGNYSVVKDFTQIYYEEKVDIELKKKDKILAEGGKEFYEKLLQRNKALRKLMEKEGESLYSTEGNINYFFRRKHIPLIERKKFFEKVEEVA